MISQKVYEKIPKICRPTLNVKNSKKSINVTADGSEIKSLGQGTFKFSLGPVVVEKLATVAKIEDEVILGVDILFSDESGPADLLLSDNTLIFKGHPLKLEVVGLKQHFCRVIASETVTLPGMSEMMIDACIGYI